jgi:3',5'-cyclic AMP phosphodiesterase CpdA
METDGTLAVFRLRRERRGPLRVTLVADTHIGESPSATFESGYNPAAHAAAVVRPAMEFDPEAVVFLGDLARVSGEPADYVHWRRLFGPVTAKSPTILLPGNHDRRDNMLMEFAPGVPPEAERAVSVLETPTVRMIALDSLYRTDVVPGLLGEAQRGWLLTQLAAPDQRPTVILVHHHLGTDDYALLDADRLLALLKPHRQIKAIVTAHQHVFRCEIVDGVHRVAAPALGMPFKPGERLGWLEACVDEAGASLRFRGLDGSSDPERRLQWRD